MMNILETIGYTLGILVVILYLGITFLAIYFLGSTLRALLSPFWQKENTHQVNASISMLELHGIQKETDYKVYSVDASCPLEKYCVRKSMGNYPS